MAAPAATFVNGRPGDYPPSTPRKLETWTLVLDGNYGAAANDIPASLFGMTVIESVSPLVKSDNTLIVDAAPAYDGKSILGKAAATAAPANIPAGTYRVTFRGY